MGACLLIWILAVYSIYRNFSNKTELSEQITSSNILIACLYGAHTIYTINWASALMVDGSEASKIIHKIMNRIQDETIKKRVRHKLILIWIDDFIAFQLLYLSQQLQHRCPVVSCGLFTINWTILHSVRIYEIDLDTFFNKLIDSNNYSWF